ncbi:hypothetical protein AXX17_ATUG03400 [Arabidopsis thaliana]|uniref:Butirosin biosynthesis protein H N-terminal domain-containing protein n=1 Tax=Arabidopsis thaliana TaxID=3702 RepID=A0A178U6B1_ARATH|nr:hypothetical protein AXX17_ATUG03400 [Arabidopsis thaliana]
MLALGLQPLKSGGDCFDDVIVSFDGWYQHGYELMYMEALKVNFNSHAAESTSIGDRLTTYLDSSLHYLQRYHGYRIEVFRNTSIQEAWRILLDQLNRGFPVGLNLDTYYSPWDVKYQISHYYSHVMIVVGFDAHARELIIVDPFFEKKDLRLSYSLFEQGYIGFMTLEPCETICQNQEILLEELLLKVQEQLETAPPAMRALAAQLPDIQHEAEFKNYEVFGECPLYHKLVLLMNGRSNFAKLLNHLDSRFHLPYYREIADEFLLLANKWNAVRGIVAKMFFSPQITKDPRVIDNLMNRILANADMEELLLQKLVDSRNNDIASTALPEIPLNNPSPEELDVHEIIPVELHSFFDNRGIENSSGTADFDSDGNYLLKQGAPIQDVFQVEDMSFSVSFLHDDRDDNLSCNNQSIPLQEDRYRGIMVLGCSQYCDNMDNFIVEYTDGTSESFALGFSDWWNASPSFGEIIAWKAQFAHNEHGMGTNSVFLFANKKVLRSHKPACRLILPIMPNIHVFAVSMWK